VHKRTGGEKLSACSGFYSMIYSVLASKESHLRFAGGPMSPRVIELNVVDRSLKTAQVKDASLTAGGNSIAKMEHFGCSVFVMNDYALKMYRGV
jgi:hypothetical protein